jgi:hypothetical protein
MEGLGKLGSSPSAYDFLYGQNTLAFTQERLELYFKLRITTALRQCEGKNDSLITVFFVCSY